MNANFETERLRNMRKEAGINQAELGLILGIARETVIHIEKGSPGSVNTLECNLIRNWYLACEPKLSPLTKQNWAGYLVTFFGTGETA